MKKQILLSFFALMTMIVSAQKKTDDKKNFETYFMPGAGWTAYKPANDSLGIFSGFTIDYLLYAKSHQNDDYGPSHVRFYSTLNLNKSNKDSVSRLFLYGLGLQMSLEKNPQRNYAIPYFGIETLGMSSKDFGSTLVFAPHGGLHAIARPGFYINLQGGYIYPLRDFENYSGYTARVSFNFAIW